jgi:hypothetical protein
MSRTKTHIDSQLTPFGVVAAMVCAAANRGSFGVLPRILDQRSAGP